MGLNHPPCSPPESSPPHHRKSTRRRLFSEPLLLCRRILLFLAHPSNLQFLPLRKIISSLCCTTVRTILLGCLFPFFLTLVSTLFTLPSGPLSPSPPHLSSALPLSSKTDLLHVPAANQWNPHSLSTHSVSIIQNSLMQNFDVPPSFSNKLPSEAQFNLLTRLQEVPTTSLSASLRLFILHVVGDVFSDRLDAISSCITYAKNTNRFLLILWDTSPSSPQFASDVLVPLESTFRHRVLLLYVNSLHLDPNISNWAEYQINYYTPSGTGGFPLHNVAALSSRHIFYRAHSKVESQYSALLPGLMLLPTLFRPAALTEPAWKSYIKDWTFPHLDTPGVADLLNRVYGVPFVFIDGMSDESMRKLLSALHRSTSKRVFFLHAQYGMGNRLRALGSAMAVAKITGRVLVLIWEPDVHLNCRFSDLFVNDIVVIDKLNMNWPPANSKRTDHALGKMDFFNFMRFQGKHIHNPLTVRVNPHIRRHVYVKSAYVVRSSFTPRIISTTSPYWKIMRTTLVPRVDIMYLVDDPAFVNIGGMVGVHIRSRTIENDIKGVSEEFYGNGSRTTDHWRRLTGLKTFEAKIMRLSLRYKFFVAADSRDAINELERKFGSHRIFSIRRDEDCVSRDVECAKLALADILLLSKVPTLLGSHWSSFTEGAVRLSGRVKVLMAGLHFGRPKN